MFPALINLSSSKPCLKDTNIERVLLVEENEISVLPPETMAKIFSYLPPSDLNECSLVCKQWNEIIKRHRAYLEAHQFDCMKFTSLTGWKANIEYGYLSVLICNNFRCENKQYFGIPSDPDDLMPSCHKKVYLDVSDVSCLHSHFGKLLNESRSRSCAQAPKTFFWEWLTRKMKDSLSRVLMLFECYITSDFIDGFSRILSELNGKTPYQVKKLVLHGCHFSELSSEKLHHLFFELINADEYIFSCISGCLDDELEFESISRFSSVQRASKLHMFGLLGEMAGMRFNGPTDEQLLDILLTENTKRYPNLTSIQLPGFNLTSGFLSKYISMLTSNKDLVSIENVHIDDLEYQRIGRELWTRVNSTKKQLKKIINNNHIVIIHQPHRTTISVKSVHPNK